MSKIYDALIKLEKKKRPGPSPFFPRNWTTQRSAPVSFPGLSFATLEQKVIGTVAGLLLVFGLVLVIVMHQLAGRALRNQIRQKALIAAINLSDAAAGHVLGKNRLELYAQVTKYARLDGSAYVFIEDQKGEIVAHTLPTFPPELIETLTLSERRRIGRRTVSFQGKSVYETRAPILEGQAGAARIGIWEESVAREVNGALLPIVGIVAGLVLAAAAATLFAAQEIFRRLAGMAGHTSAGERSTVGNQLTNDL